MASKNKLAKVETTELDAGKQEKFDLQTWTKQFNNEPDQDMVKINRMANNAPYLPISHIENLLDKYFFGLWSIDNFQYQTIANELAGSLELRVRHPLTGETIVRTGVGAVQIRINSNSGEKIKNALVADMGHLKSECLKNAAKSLGNVFGRNIGRKIEDVDEFEVLLQKKEETKQKDKDLFEE